ncbi:MAG: hypothetical protein H3C62_00450 [Gemmatimonadaceae bacterium]|nr:hypothetical protein [Gemmatimonadaceae bacterium]
MTHLSRTRAALLLVCLATAPLSAQGLLDEFTQKIASLAGARCWAVASLAVQLKGRPFCQHTKGSSPYYEQGRQQRVVALKALGQTLGMLYAREARQEKFVQHRQRLEQLARTLAIGVMDSVIVPSERLRIAHRTSPAQRIQYRLSAAVVTLLGEQAGVRQTPLLTDADRLVAALTVRTFAAANAMDQQGDEAVQQTAERAAALRTGGAQGAEAARIGVEGIALINSTQGSAAIGRAQAQQLLTFQTMQTERALMLRSWRTWTSRGTNP